MRNTKLSRRRFMAALGLGTVGHIDPERGLWLQSYNIPISRPVELGRLLEARYGLPSAIDNDVRCAARGEWAFGGGQSHTMLYLNVGTGIGSALISQGNGLARAGGPGYESVTVGHAALNANRSLGAVCDVQSFV